VTTNEVFLFVVIFYFIIIIIGIFKPLFVSWNFYWHLGADAFVT